MDNLVLGMTVLVCLIMSGAMTWITFHDGQRDTRQTDMREIVNLLAKFDDWEALATPRLDGSGDFRGRSDDEVAASWGPYGR